jgi:fluoroquinolone resistance protein
VCGVLVEEATFSGEDWYGEELVDRGYLRCRFVDVDLTEAVVRGSQFEECQFLNVRFNASRHADAAYLRCAFRHCNLFEAAFDGCKLVGSSFHECDLRPLTVTGGDWSFVNLAGADLRGSDLTSLDPRTCEIAGAVIDGDQAVVLALALGFTVR